MNSLSSLQHGFWNLTRQDLEMDIKFYNNKILNNPIISLTNPQKAGILQNKTRKKDYGGRGDGKKVHQMHVFDKSFLCNSEWDFTVNHHHNTNELYYSCFQCCGTPVTGKNELSFLFIRCWAFHWTTEMHRLTASITWTFISSFKRNSVYSFCLLSPTSLR